MTYLQTYLVFCVPARFSTECCETEVDMNHYHKAYIFLHLPHVNYTKLKNFPPKAHLPIISSRYRDYYVGMTKVQNGVLYICDRI